MNNEVTYLTQLQDILETGVKKEDRTGTGTFSLTGVHSRYRLYDGFPLLTTKKMQWKSIVGELLWILSGSTNAHELRDKYGTKIWMPWADKDGELGPIYGRQLRMFPVRDDLRAQQILGIDQVKDVIHSIQTNPLSRRHIMTTWNPAEIHKMNLPPCHGISIQFVCEPVTNLKGHPGYELSCIMHQRSGDMFLGVPFNIASYSLLTEIIAKACRMVPGEFIHTIGDAHIYLNHQDQVREQLDREVLDPPEIEIDPFNSIDELTPDHIHLHDYDHHSAIKAKVAV